MSGAGQVASETVAQEGTARKVSLREELTARRKAMTPDIIDERGLKVQARFLATPYYQKARTVALYAPIRGEVPTRDILIAALQDEKIVCYPLSHVHGRILSFRAIKSEAELEPGRLGVREPTNSAELIPVDQIDLFVVPGLGFTRDGKRLGRGGGYYDATLKAASARSRRVGLAFGDQIVDTMPTTNDDVDMDLVVTESETMRGLYRDWDFLDT
ncbi:5-formyltetrahydrofolate cyclo-ligase [Archangium minus]|uniref:5-formyltetrahydrofolate cyclo-ligase n=1 Tax=Archangium minus TaxID=83450 RepID=A0ABY9WZX2_9BACT|nr:5-formyltetrahydrofolate cyclo-ligase [Archangium violaceum]WNG38279.1 5-formyltetrahydrofolate cyclo-ligase [Archangium violaceum]WNG48699.1 5-formyltetrahydrofolate cyclo-ligase [Archangium minus]